MDIEKLHNLIETWRAENYQARRSLHISITLSPTGTQLRLYHSELLPVIFGKLYQEQPNRKHTITRVLDTVRYECKKQSVDWNSATLQDFLRIFPSQASFQSQRQIGAGSVTLVCQLFQSAGIPWSEH